MAKKTRKKSAAKSKKGKKSKRAAAGARKRRKAAVKKTATKQKGIVGTIVGAATAVIDTLTSAERLHHKLEPHVSRDPE